MWIGIGILALACGWMIDELIKAPTATFDQFNRFTGWEHPKYKSIWDYLKTKWRNGGIR